MVVAMDVGAAVVVVVVDVLVSVVLVAVVVIVDTVMGFVVDVPVRVMLVNVVAVVGMVVVFVVDVEGMRAWSSTRGERPRRGREDVTRWWWGGMVLGGTRPERRRCDAADRCLRPVHECRWSGHR